MVERLTTSGDGVQVVVGAAGTGKTYALSVAREVWERAGFRVLGAALAARAAGELQDGAGITSTTMAALDHAIATGRSRFANTDILVVDEAAMAGTRMVSRVVENVTDAGAGVVLVGDHHQLPEIDTGGAFASLARHLDAIHLTVNRRQVHAWERDALANLRDGDVALALRALDDAERTRSFDSLRQARTALVADWLESTTEAPYLTNRMYALRRSDVDALNDEARLLLRRHHRIGDDIYTSASGSASGMGFARDDEVLCLRNDRYLSVVNGTTGRVASANAGCLTIAGPRGTFHLDEHYIASGNVAYGYATTIHKSQGATVDRAFVLGTAGLYREAGYVALSRARQSSRLYVADGGIESGLTLETNVESAHTPTEPDRRTLVDTLSISRAKTMARDELRSLPDELSRRYSSVTNPAHLALWNAVQTDLTRPPLHVVDAIGDQPATERQRANWERAVHTIQYYRERSGFDGETALGPMPSGSLARMSYQRALNAIAAYRLQCERENERSRDNRGRDFGLSL